jgi:hypothetical protein
MPRPTAKRKEGNGKSTDEENSHRVCFPRGTKVVELPEVPLVVMPEAMNARASTPSTIVMSTKILPSEPSSNLSAAFAAELSALNMKIPSSVVKKQAEYIDFCDSAQVKRECLMYIKNVPYLPIDQQSQILFLVRKFNSNAIKIAFSMLIGKVAGVASMAFFQLPPKKEDLIQQFLCLIYDTKSMMINTEEECYRYVKKYSDSENFV